MTTRLGSKGQVVIPKRLRDELALHPGDEVDITAEGELIIVRPRRHPRPLGGRFGQSGMAERLLADRADEPR